MNQDKKWGRHGTGQQAWHGSAPHSRGNVIAFRRPGADADTMARRMEAALTEAGRVAVELIGEHFIWHSPEALEILALMPPLGDARLDSIIDAIREGARIPTDCDSDHYLYLVELLVNAVKVRDFDTRRTRVLAWRRCLEEYEQLELLRAAWCAEDAPGYAQALDALRRVQDDGDELVSALPVTCVAEAQEPPTPLFRHGPAPGGFGLIVGADGVGKGWLTLDILLSAALGQPLNIPAFAREGAPLRVLYVCYEDDPRFLRWRLDRIAEAAGMDRNAWRAAEREGRLQVVVEAGALFAQHGRDMPEPTASCRALTAMLRRHRVDLCVIDPMASAALLQSENDNSAMNAVATTLRDIAQDTGSAVILTHHTSKAGRADDDHHAARGGSALVGAARWVLRLRQSGLGGNLLCASVPKNSYGRRLPEITLERRDTGALHELTRETVGKQKELLTDELVRFVEAHPEIELNPNAIRRNNSPGAQALCAALDAKPGVLYSAAQSAIRQGRLMTEERRRKNNHQRYTVLVPVEQEGLEEDEGILF